MKRENWLSPKEFAERRGVHYITVLEWLRAEMVPGAEKMEFPSGKHHYYRVPESAVKDFVAPRPGPAKGSKRKTNRPR